MIWTILFCVRGRGFYEVNRDHEIVWSLADLRASHDIDPLENGNLLVTYTWAKKGGVLAAEITRDGTPVWTFDGLSLFSDSKYDGFQDEIGAWAHVNGAERLSSGHTVLTVRNFNALVEVSEVGEVVDIFWLDAQKSKTTLGSKGLLRGGRPHGATRKPNEDHLTVITRSPHRAVEYDLLENRVLRAWWGLDLRGAQRKVRDVVPLPNEHWLMRSPSTLFELDANNRMVWQYSPPLDPSDERDSIPLFKAMFRAPEGIVYGN